MVVDYNFLFDMMLTAMMHYSWNEDHFFLCHRHWGLDNLLHVALKNALLRDHLWPLHNFLLLMWDVNVHNHDTSGAGVCTRSSRSPHAGHTRTDPRHNSDNSLTARRFATSRRTAA